MTARSPLAPAILAASCPRCLAGPGQRCATGQGRLASASHHARRWAAAHQDPALDEQWGDQGPCGICAVPGIGARHRVIDSAAGWLAASAAAGETEGDPAAMDDGLAAEFGVKPEAIAAVRAWMGKWPGAWR